jgi:hypothetical protein
VNPVGIPVPGGRIAPATRDVIAYRDGVPVDTGALGAVLSRTQRAVVDA